MQEQELRAILEDFVGRLLSERRRERQRHVLRELEKEFIYGTMLPARLRAERLLHPIEKSAYRDRNFQEMYRDMAIDQYADIAVVLNLFRLLNSYKEAGDIDETETRRSFGWIYGWWWAKVIEHYSRGLTDDPDWEPHLKKHEWLLESNG